MWYFVFFRAVGVLVIRTNVVNRVWIRRINGFPNDGGVSRQCSVGLNIEVYVAWYLHFTLPGRNKIFLRNGKLTMSGLSYVTNYPTLPLVHQHSNYEHKSGSIVRYDNIGTFAENSNSGVSLPVEWFHTAAQRNAIVSAITSRNKVPFQRAVHIHGDPNFRSVGVFENRKLQRFERVQSHPTTNNIKNWHSGHSESNMVYNESDSFVPEIRNAY